MMNETVTLLKEEQGEDDGEEASCIKSFGQMKNEAKVLAHRISGHRDAIADYKDQRSNAHARIERIAEEIIDVLIPQVMEETVEAVKLILQDKVRKCTVELGQTFLGGMSGPESMPGVP